MVHLQSLKQLNSLRNEILADSRNTKLIKSIPENVLPSKRTSPMKIKML